MAKKIHQEKAHATDPILSLSLPLNSFISAFPDCSTSSSLKVSPCRMFYWVFPSYSFSHLCIFLQAPACIANNFPVARHCCVYIYPRAAATYSSSVSVKVFGGTILSLKINQHINALRVHWDMSWCVWTCQHSDIYIAAAALTCMCWEHFIGDLLTAVPGKSSSVLVCARMWIWLMFGFSDS